MARKPLAIARRAAAADEQVRQLSGERERPSPVALVEADAAPTEDAPDPVPAVDAQGGGVSVPQHAEQPEAEAQPEAGVSPDAPETEQDGGNDEPDTYEHRFRVLQGKYRAETKTLREQNESLARNVDDLRSTLAMLQAQFASSKNEPKAEPKIEEKPVVAPKLVSPKEVDEYGQDSLDIHARYAQQVWEPRVVKLENQIASLRSELAKLSSTTETVKTTVTTDARSRMHKTLDDSGIDWRAINKDVDFKGWLGQEDEFSGELRQNLLLRAYERNDAERVLRFFKTYLAEHASDSEPAKGRSAESSPNPASAAGDKTPRVDPATLVAPGRGRTAPRQVGAQSPQAIVWTPRDIAAFYADVSAGRFKHNPDEAARLESDIFAAQREGRVVA